MLDLRHILRLIRVYVPQIQVQEGWDIKPSQTSKGLCIISKILTDRQGDCCGMNGAVLVRKIKSANSEPLEFFPSHPLDGCANQGQMIEGIDKEKWCICIMVNQSNPVQLEPLNDKQMWKKIHSLMTP